MTAPIQSGSIGELFWRVNEAVVLIDLTLPDGSGMSLLDTLRVRWPHSIPVMLSGISDLTIAHETLAKGALGYIVKPSFWGQGYGTEMATAVASHAFTALNLSNLVAFTRHDNIASRRVMEKVKRRTPLGNSPIYARPIIRSSLISLKMS